MKKVYSSVLIVAITIVLAFNFDSCTKPEDPTEGAKLIVNYDLIQTEFSVRFYNAKTGEMIGTNDNKMITVSITGESSDAVIDFAGRNQDSYEAANGFLNLYLNPNSNYVPSNSNPIRFNILTDVPGYLASGKTMLIPKEGSYFIEMMLVEIDNPPSGVSIKNESNVGTLVDGAVTEEIIVVTPDEKARFILPEGIILKDNTGNLLQGSINVTLTYFSNVDDESLAAYPGGLITSIYQDGQYLDGVFYSAGFVAIEVVDQNNVKARKFENGKGQLDMVVPLNTYNPETNTYVEAGDEVSLYSYETGTGQWTYESTTTILETEKRFGYGVSVQLKHLSYWNFDWFLGEYCYWGIGLQFTGNYGDCECVTLSGVMRKTEDNTFLAEVYMEACEGEPVQMTYVPSGMPVYIDWDEITSCSNYSVGPEYNPLWIDDLCADALYDVPLTYDPGSSKTVTVEISGTCVNYPDVVLLPSFGVWFRKANDFCWRWASMHNGVAEVCDVEVGANYIIGVYYDNIWEQWQVTVDQEDYMYLDLQFNEDVCASILN